MVVHREVVNITVDEVLDELAKKNQKNRFNNININNNN
jgi:hypothetical protein